MPDRWRRRERSIMMEPAVTAHDEQLRRLRETLRDSYDRQSLGYDARRTVDVNGRFFFE